MTKLLVFVNDASCVVNCLAMGLGLCWFLLSKFYSYNSGWRGFQMDHQRDLFHAPYSFSNRYEGENDLLYAGVCQTCNSANAPKAFFIMC